jgi:heptosyltransferase-2
VDIGSKLLRRKVEVYLVGGRREILDLNILHGLLKLPWSHVVIGDDNFQAFLDKISTLDLLIATDSGTAHICSLVVPVLSIFGPGPSRRYAPFGAHNRVLTLDLVCSPCYQFDKKMINLCVSRECMNTILPDAVFEAIWLDNKTPQIDDTTLRPVKIIYGASHL